jgi:Xaa-Pro dipeptidase
MLLTLRNVTSFFYLTGVNFADCFVTYDIESDHLALWIPYVEPRQVLWFGHTPNTSQALEKYDVDEVRYSSELPGYIQNHVALSTTLYVLHGDQMPRRMAQRMAPQRMPQRMALRSDTAKRMEAVLMSLGRRVDTLTLQPAMDRARVIKTDAEVALIRHANHISSAAHRRVAENLLKLTNERQIQAIILAVCNARGAPTQAYPVIAGAGVNASTLHYGENDQPLQGKQVVVIDAGCEYSCYASDVTRTLPIAGKFTPEAAAVYGVVQNMQEQCIAMVRPGVEWYKVHLLAVRLAQEGLMKLGILKGDAKAIAEAGTATAFFPHGLGHHVGLEVHDVSGAISSVLFENFKVETGKREMVDAAKLAKLQAMASNPASILSVRAGQRLEPNMIVTVEPGM